MQHHCPTCKRFVSIRTVVVDDAPDLDMGDGLAAGEFHIANRCQKCEREMSEYRFEITIDPPAKVEAHLRTRSAKHKVSIAVVSATPFQHHAHRRKGNIQQAGVRAILQWTCACDAGWIYAEAYTMRVQTSAMTNTSRNQTTKIRPFRVSPAKDAS